VETAVFTHELLTKHGIVHWLDYGSLLGAVRGGELIPWDNDVDFGFLGSDLRGDSTVTKLRIVGSVR
jgi:phosphorylcholine metabolism protein LicD